MTPLRWTAIASVGALISLTSLAILPLAGYTSTAGLWLTYATIAGGLTTMVTTIAAMAALTPPAAPTAPQEPAKPIVRAYVVRDTLPPASGPVRGAIELPAGSVR